MLQIIIGVLAAFPFPIFLLHHILQNTCRLFRFAFTFLIVIFLFFLVNLFLLFIWSGSIYCVLVPGNLCYDRGMPLFWRIFFLEYRGSSTLKPSEMGNFVIDEDDSRCIPRPCDFSSGIIAVISSCVQIRFWERYYRIEKLWKKKSGTHIP